MNGRQVGFLVDTTRCINCKTCEVACRDLHQAGPGITIRRVRSFEGGEFPRIFAYAISMSCNHCAAPACVEACPAGAYTKREDDGIVVHDPDRCIGCAYCTWACPYGAPQYDARDGRVRKCNLCIEHQAEGEVPVCVGACPMRAIEVGAFDELATRAGATAAVRGVPSPNGTRPSCVFIVRRETLDAE